MTTLSLDKLEKHKEYILPKAIHIQIKTKYSVEKLLTKDIIYIEKTNRKTYIHEIDSTFETTNTFDELSALVETHNFLSPYKNILVNVHWIKKISGYEITLKNGEQLPLSQKKAAQFKKNLNQILSIM